MSPERVSGRRCASTPGIACVCAEALCTARLPSSAPRDPPQLPRLYPYWTAALLVRELLLPRRGPHPAGTCIQHLVGGRWAGLASILDETEGLSRLQSSPGRPLVQLRCGSPLRSLLLPPLPAPRTPEELPCQPPTGKPSLRGSFLGTPTQDIM